MLAAGSLTLADSRECLRVLETSHPPVYYVPPAGILLPELLVPVPGMSTFCEFKGAAEYWALAQQPGRAVAWSYPEPSRRFAALRGFFAFYPSRVDACYVDDERVTAQAGDFYGGWITSDIRGPFKGEPGTSGW